MVTRRHGKRVSDEEQLRRLDAGEDPATVDIPPVSDEERGQRIADGEDPETAHVPRNELRKVRARKRRASNNHGQNTPNEPPLIPFRPPGMRILVSGEHNGPEDIPCRQQCIHALRFIRPGARVRANVILRNLPPGSWILEHDENTQLRYVRTEVYNLMTNRDRYRRAGLEQVAAQGDAAQGTISRHPEESPGKRGRPGFPRCLVRVSHGVYEVLPEVYEPQTDVERSHGVPGEASMDPPRDDRIDDAALMAWAHELGLDFQLHEARWHFGQLLTRLGY